jgi:hypothetical protein
MKANLANQFPFPLLRFFTSSFQSASQRSIGQDFCHFKFIKKILFQKTSAGGTPAVHSFKDGQCADL